MRAIRMKKTLEKDGEIVLTGLPFTEGQTVRVTVSGDPSEGSKPRGIPASELLNCGLVGIWADREDIGDSVEFARKLREEAQRRTRGTDSRSPERK